MIIQQELGLGLRDYGMTAVDESTDQDWKNIADGAIEQLARAGQPFTAEDVRKITGDPPKVNALGPRFMAAVKSGIIRKIAYIRATRPKAHARALALYEGRLATP